jgi:hypothetical protein
MRLSVITIALLLQIAALAHADEPGRAEARAHFKHGVELLRHGAYPEALTEFQEAYRLFPNERLHFDIAQAYRLMGERQAAIDHYRLYLASVDVGDTAEDARRQLAALGATAEPVVAPPPSQPGEPPTNAPPPTVPPTVPPPPENVVPGALKQPPPAIVAKPVAEPGHARLSRRRLWIGVIVGGVAVVGAAVGLGVGLGARTHYPQASWGTIGVPTR